MNQKAVMLLAPVLIGVSTLIALSFICYYYFVQVPSKEKLEMQLTILETERKSVGEQEQKLDNCLDKTTQEHKDRWNRSCKYFSAKDVDGGDGNCLLPEIHSEGLKEVHELRRQECFARYN